MAQGNPERGELTFVVKGKSYVLKLTMKALVALQKRTGKTFGELLTAIAKLDVEALSELVWMMLQTHHAKEFENQDSVLDFIDQAGGFANVVKTVGEALQAGMNPPTTTAAASSPQ